MSGQILKARRAMLLTAFVAFAAACLLVTLPVGTADALCGGSCAVSSGGDGGVVSVKSAGTTKASKPKLKKKPGIYYVDFYDGGKAYIKGNYIVLKGKIIYARDVSSLANDRYKTLHASFKIKLNKRTNYIADKFFISKKVAKMAYDYTGSGCCYKKSVFKKLLKRKQLPFVSVVIEGNRTFGVYCDSLY